MKRNEKGITLIALIITIIVMLILVAVTVAFAINGGLFERAKEGAAGTEKEAIREAIIGSYDIEKDGASAPITTSDFGGSGIYCSSYLNRIISNFTNQ